MPKIDHAEMTRALHDAGLEKAGEGVVFPWGVKIVDVNGKKMLQPMTPDEYRSSAEADLGRKLTDAEVQNPYCSVSGLQCVSIGCEAAGGRCSLQYNMGYYCLCDH